MFYIVICVWDAKKESNVMNALVYNQQLQEWLKVSSLILILLLDWTLYKKCSHIPSIEHAQYYISINHLSKKKELIKALHERN